jgi:electron transfer flavoprotein alpha subunit
MARDVLVLVEHAEGKIDSITLQLMSAGRGLTTALGGKLVVMATGHPLDPITAGLQGYDVDKIVVVDDPPLASAAGELQARVVARVARRLEPRFVLVGYSLIGMELAPAIAVRLGINALTNCVGLDTRAGTVTVTRAVFDNTQHTEITVDESAVIALQKGVFAPMAPSSHQAVVESISLNAADLPPHSKVLAISSEPAGAVDITKAEIVVSVGRGIGSEDKISLVAELAEALGGVLACSRPVVDVGWLPRERQVGASGKTVTPKVYLACGISGAIQHLTGMRESARIIAINKDPNAPIFGVAHTGVVGDLFEIIPALTKAAKEAKAQRS